MNAALPARPRRALLVAVRPDGVEELQCPAPGRVRWAALAGSSLVEGSVLGQLMQTDRAYDLVLPAGVHGQLREVLVRHHWASCGYATPLAVLGAVEAAPVGLPEHEAAGARGALEVRAPSHGTFYRRPAPGSPAYVETGGTVEADAIVGLVEVMKCFSPIRFAVPGVARARLVECLVDDGTEVRADQVLLRFERAE